MVVLPNNALDRYLTSVDLLDMVNREEVCGVVLVVNLLRLNRAVVINPVVPYLAGTAVGTTNPSTHLQERIATRKSKRIE
jgi:hypothetical protein